MTRSIALKKLGLIPLAFVITLAVGAAPALAADPWWQLSQVVAPTDLTPGGRRQQIVVTAEDLGDLPVTDSPTPVSITDVLPPGVLATGDERAHTSSSPGSEKHGPIGCSPSPPATTFPAASITCTWSEPSALQPFEALEVAIEVEVLAGARSSSETGQDNEVSISGGEGFTTEPDGIAVAPVSLARPLMIGAGPTPFGIDEYLLTPENEGGGPDTQAGSHPFQVTTTIAFNQAAAYRAHTRPEPEEAPAMPKDLHFQWPPGMIGNPTALPQCSESEFAAELSGGSDLCPADTAVGVASVTVIARKNDIGLIMEEVPVFNLVPERGEPARFGFEADHAIVTIDPSLRTGGDYGITVSSDNITQLIVNMSARVTVWGVPGDPHHDAARGWGCMEEGVFAEAAEGKIPRCAAETQSQPSPFLSMPTSCTGPLQTSLEATSWAEPDKVVTVSPSEPMPAMTGCDRLPSDASIAATSDSEQASRPMGLNVDVHVPQEVSQDAEGLTESDLKNITVALPEGVAINPSGGNGLEACSGNPGDLVVSALGSPGDEIGFTGTQEFNPSSEPEVKTDTFTSRLPGSTDALNAGETSSLAPGVNFCPNASKVGTATIKTPLLTHPLEGAVYVASQNENPFGSLIAMYIVAEDPVSGVLVKLAGQVHLSATGQIVTTFENNPQAPFEDAELHFFGGERAPLSTPRYCGAYTTTASLAPWSGNTPTASSSTFNITSGPGGGPCPGQSLPFAPELHSSSSNVDAGAFSDLTTTLGREDGNQDLQSVTLHYPPGVSGLLAGVPLCPEQQANEGTCPAASQIGETVVSAGVGSDPVTVTGGKVYITESYHGAPFGLSITNPVKAGPFDLEHDTSNPGQDPACDCVVVRAKIEVNPFTAALTVTTNNPREGYSIPHIIDGIPTQIKHVSVVVNRPGFTVNPTNCNKMEVTGTISSDERGSSEVKQPFPVANCAALKFAPKLSVVTSGKTSKADGASLISTVTYPNGPQGTYANVARVKVELPEQLPSRLTTLQKACLAAVFEANPASCPAESIVGHAIAYTPLLPVPLTGPAYFVSHGGEAFPSLTMVLQGDNVTIDLVGSTLIRKGVTSTTFKAVPDNPVSSFELTLPEGKYSALTANANLCQTNLTMPTEFVGQNGAEIHESTPIKVEGCATNLSVISHSVKHGTLSLAVYVPSPGKLTATGRGLSKASKTAKSHEVLKLALKTTKTGKLTTKVKLSFAPTKGEKLTAALTARLKN